MKRVGFLIAIVFVLPAAVAAERGIEAVPDETGVFVYEDDYATPRFLSDAFLENTDAGVWTAGALVHSGPYRNRSVTYRFYGARPITALRVTVEQEANKRSLGGHNAFFVSPNGLDWTEAAISTSQEPDGNGWQNKPFSVPEELAARYGGATEFWIRLTLDNNSGLETSVSNSIKSLRVELTLGEAGSASPDPQAALRTAWSALRRELGWAGLTLDSLDVAGQRAPHYYEDVDGWLQPPGTFSLAPDEEEGFLVSRVYSDGVRAPLSLAAFVETRASETPVMACVTIRSDRNTHRKVNVLWDGRVVATVDAASFFDFERDFFVVLADKPAAGVHEVRIAGEDVASALIRRVTVIGQGVVGWAEKPALPEGGPLTVLSAYYMPDPLPPAASQAVEGRKETQAIELTGLTFEGLQRFYTEHAQFGALRVVVKNTGLAPVRIGNAIELNGKAIEESYVDFAASAWDAPGVVWRRMRPRTLAPGQCGQLYVRFRHRPEGEAAAITIPLENGPSLQTSIPYEDPGVAIDYVTIGPDRTMLYIYARKTAGNTANAVAFRLDGARLDDAAVHGAGFPGGVALGVARMASPLLDGEYHVAGVEREDGTCVDAQFRVLPFFFPRSSIHVPFDLCRDMHMNLATWLIRPFEECVKFGIPTSAMHTQVMQLHTQAPIIFAPDEPDAKDNRGGGYDKGLGWHARMLSESGWQELVERWDHPVASWNNMDGTVRPLNWAVYGQFGDLNGFDPYPVTYYGADHAYVRESLSYVRQCCAPTPMYAILEAYGWGEGQGVPSGARGPTAAEYRQNVVQSIGSGMKGLTSWVFSAGAGGWQLDEPFAQEITKLNRLLEHIEPELLLGVPVDLTTCDAGEVATGTVGNEHWPKSRVWAGSLLCGSDAILIAVVNHIPAVKPGTPAIEPAKDVVVTCALPEFLQHVEGFEYTEDGQQPLPVEQAGGLVTLRLDALESGRVFLLRRARP